MVHSTYVRFALCDSLSGIGSRLQWLTGLACGSESVVRFPLLGFIHNGSLIGHAVQTFRLALHWLRFVLYGSLRGCCVFRWFDLPIRYSPMALVWLLSPRCRAICG